jgi:hypothetical protein
VDFGFDVERLAFIETDAAFAGYTADRITALQESLLQRLAALPGVQSAALTVGPPPEFIRGIRIGGGQRHCDRA